VLSEDHHRVCETSGVTEVVSNGVSGGLSPLVYLRFSFLERRSPVAGLCRVDGVKVIKVIKTSSWISSTPRYYTRVQPLLLEANQKRPFIRPMQIFRVGKSDLASYLKTSSAAAPLVEPREASRLQTERVISAPDSCEKLDACCGRYVEAAENFNSMCPCTCKLL